jgi:molybdopterin/thiamine biosynthesis adenylyltransferase
MKKTMKESLPMDADKDTEDMAGRVLEIVVPASVWRDLRAHLLREAPRPRGRRSRIRGVDEQLAFLLASVARSPRGIRLLVREMLPAGPVDLAEQSPVSLVARPAFVLRALERCRAEGLHLIEVHSHPFSCGLGTTFSGTDWDNDRLKMPALAALVEQSFIHATMVLGRDSLDAHWYHRPSGEILTVRRVVVVGVADEQDATDTGGPDGSLRHLTPTGCREAQGHDTLSSEELPRKMGTSASGRHARQELFLGARAQIQLALACVAVVGLGGLGSFVATELAHLGVGHLILIDHDAVEETNLNRLLGAGTADVGRAKVDVYAERARAIAPDIRVTTVRAPLLDERALAAAKMADVLLGCVDNHGARLVLNQLAMRYLIPLVDGGSGIRLAGEREPLVIGGQMQLVVPGAGCLECRGSIDARRAAFDLAPPECQAEERSHGYGLDGPAPSVIALNGVIASLQVAEVLFLLAPDPDRSMGCSHVSRYNALARQLIPMRAHAAPGCPTCSPEGVLGVGDLAPLGAASSRCAAPDV